MKDTIHDGKHQSMQFQEGDVVMMDFNLKGKTKPRESKLKTKEGKEEEPKAKEKGMLFEKGYTVVAGSPCVGKPKGMEQVLRERNMFPNG